MFLSRLIFILCSFIVHLNAFKELTVVFEGIPSLQTKNRFFTQDLVNNSKIFYRSLKRYNFKATLAFRFTYSYYGSTSEEVKQDLREIVKQAFKRKIKFTASIYPGFGYRETFMTQEQRNYINNLCEIKESDLQSEIMKHANFIRNITNVVKYLVSGYNLGKCRMRVEKQMLKNNFMPFHVDYVVAANTPPNELNNTLIFEELDSLLEKSCNRRSIVVQIPQINRKPSDIENLIFTIKSIAIKNGYIVV
jgi:hypothetical protein